MIIIKKKNFFGGKNLMKCVFVHSMFDATKVEKLISKGVASFDFVFLALHKSQKGKTVVVVVEVVVV